MNNIILIGMPGVGKSTVGVVLAKKMGYQFVDSDLIIQEKEKRLLHEIIEQEGIDGFIEIEDRINAQIEMEHTVLATGGIAVYGEHAMKHFAECVTIVYLSLPYEELCDRLGDLNERGVSIRPGQTLEDLLKERTPLYERYADVTINCQNRQIREIVKMIREEVQGSDN